MWPPPVSDLYAAAVIGAGFLAVIVIAEIWSRFGRGDPEWTRKLVHITGGFICLSFPFVLRSAWTVLLLSLLMTALFVFGAETRMLQCLHRVKRRSRGSEYYPLSVFLVFFLARGHPWLYVASMLVLAVADAFAALIGMRYGRLRYKVEEETKSVEGSLAFLAIAFVAILAPALLLSGLPLEVCVLSALLVAALVTGFEAICLTGTDNLFVPLGTCVILGKITTKPVPEILYQNVSFAALLLLIGFLAWRVRAMNVGGALVMALFTYGAWSLGSEGWGLPILAGFLGYSFLCARHPLGEAQRVRVVFRAISIPLVVLLFANMLHREERLYLPFLAALAAVLVLSLRNHLRMPANTGPDVWPADRIWPAGHMLLTAAAALLTLALVRAGWIPAWAGP